MKTLIHRYLTLILSVAALVATTGAFASDTLNDFVKLQRSGVSEDVIVAWAAKQPPVEPTKEAMDTLIQAKVSGRVAQALLLGNSRPGYVPPKAIAQAQPAEAVQQPAQPDDNVVIQPVTRDVTPDTVVVDGGVTYYPDVYADWPYVWSPYWNWNYGTYGYWGWHNGRHNGWHDGRNGGWSGYHSGQFNSVRHEQSPARTQSLPQTQTHISHSYVPAQDHAVTSHQSYSGTTYSHGNSGGYTGHSYSSGGYSGGHSYSGGGFSGGHSFGGGGHGGGRR